jgi:hypothetical protein
LIEGLRWDRMGIVDSHPSHKDKGVARVGHPGSWCVATEFLESHLSHKDEGVARVGHTVLIQRPASIGEAYKASISGGRLLRRGRRERGCVCL